MPPIQSRPSAGNWIENRTLVRHTPDAVVLINGYEEFATCPSCNRTINLQKFITTIDADATTEMVANANFSVTIPQYELSRFMRDGVPILQPSLEVVIFMRGYFPMKGFADLGQEANPDFDANNVPVYPYYQVFRGVVTNVSHSYSGGFYTATVQCANFLHFWQSQHISTNGAVFASRPKGSMVEPSLVGQKLTGMNPYELVYTLVKATFGAAYGVEFKFSKSANTSAEDDVSSRNMFTHAAEWWAKNFSKNQGSLRMYGADGKLFNEMQQSFLGAWSSISGNDFSKNILSRIYTALSLDNTKTPMSGTDFLLKLRANLFNKVSTVQAVAYGDGAVRTVDVLSMQAFILDIGKMGQISLFESEYMTKSQIAQEVMTISGYELYQDVDGDIVFKPPMYNMDTSSDPVYVVEDRDLISVTETETEPEATMVKATGNHFANLGGHGIENWMGVGAVFIDYRLVAKFGYKEETFESNYISSRHALYISCVNRLDLANIGVKSATVTIPLRPEMRAGYPIYIRSMDCFYYAKSISNSFAFNGQCTSTITCVAKRAKWFPPMSSTSGGELPSLGNVKLDAPGEYPARPLMAYPQYLDPSNSDGPPQAVGFPNVIMALDPDKVNIDSIDIPRSILTAEAYVELALSKGILERDTSDKNKYILRSGPSRGHPVTLKEIQEGYASVDAALSAGTLGSGEPIPTTAFGKVLAEVEKVYNSIDSPEVKQLVNYLALQTSLKSYYAPGMGILGRYRYYSCSHPEKDQQAPQNLLLDPEETDSEKRKKDPGPAPGSTDVETFEDAGPKKGIRVVSKTPLWGVEIANITNLGEAKSEQKTIVVPTSDIRYVTAGPQYQRNFLRVSAVQEGWSEGRNFRLAEGQTKSKFKSLMEIKALKDPALSLGERISEEYTRILTEIDTFAQRCGVEGDAKVIQAQSTAKNFFTDNSKYSQTAGVAYKKQGDSSAISNAVMTPATELWNYVGLVVERAIAKQKLQDAANDTTNYGTTRSEKYRLLMQYRATFIKSYSDGIINIPDDAPAWIYDLVDEEEGKKTYKISWTPIFPISDGAGYEVFGNLPYGRGVTIEKYAALLQVTRDVPQGVTDPAQAAVEGKTNIQNYGVNASSLEAVERFMAAWAAVKFEGGKQTATEVLQTSALFSESDQASVLAGFNTDLAGLQGVVEALYSGSTSESAQIRNRPVTSFSRGQSFTSEAAAENLARLTYGDTACSCRGSDAMFLVEALAEEFVEVYGTDPLIPWMQGQVYTPQTNTGEYTKKVIAGEYLDTRNNNLAEQFTAQGDVAQSYTESAENLTAGITNLTRGR